jgi:hypothetical protein
LQDDYQEYKNDESFHLKKSEEIDFSSGWNWIRGFLRYGNFRMRVGHSRLINDKVLATGGFHADLRPFNGIFLLP